MSNRCMDCGVIISRGAKRCRSCAGKRNWEKGIYGEEWRQKQSQAIKEAHAKGTYKDIYRKEIQEKKSKSLKVAWARGDFDDEGIRQRISESVKVAWVRGDLGSKEHRLKISQGVRAAYASGLISSPERNEKISQVQRESWRNNNQRRRNAAKSMRARWAQGVFDGVFPPTKPERRVMAVLDSMGIEYEFNTFRLESYIYDFYLPCYNTLLEYDGWYWHSLPIAQQNEAIKNNLAQNHGYRILRLRGKRSRDLTGAEIESFISKKVLCLERCDSDSLPLSSP